MMFLLLFIVMMFLLLFLCLHYLGVFLMLVLVLLPIFLAFQSYIFLWTFDLVYGVTQVGKGQTCFVGLHLLSEWHLHHNVVIPELNFNIIFSNCPAYQEVKGECVVDLNKSSTNAHEFETHSQVVR